MFILVGCPPQQRQVMEKFPRDSLIQISALCKKEQLITSALGLDASSYSCYRSTSMPPKQNTVKECLGKPHTHAQELGNNRPGAIFSAHITKVAPRALEAPAT